jgi:hypothetical protein
MQDRNHPQKYIKIEIQNLLWASQSRTSTPAHMGGASPSMYSKEILNSNATLYRYTLIGITRSIIVISILTVLTVFGRKLSLNSLSIMEIMAIHSWKSQYMMAAYIIYY